MATAIECWIPGVSHESLPDKILNSLPCKLLFCGFLPLQWTTLQTDHHHNLAADPKKFSGSSWSVQLLRMMWNNIHTWWKERNSVIHGQDDDPEHRRLNSQIRALHQSKSQLTAKHRTWLEKPEEEVLEAPIDFERAWIATHAPAVQRGLNLAQRLVHREQNAIASHFQCTGPSRTTINTSASPSRHDNGPPAPD